MNTKDNDVITTYALDSIIDVHRDQSAHFRLVALEGGHVGIEMQSCAVIPKRDFATYKNNRVKIRTYLIGMACGFLSGFSLAVFIGVF